MSGIYWLASYPKSGNTWMRAFLANYLASKGEPLDINNLNIGGIASNREVFDVWVGVKASDLTPEEVRSFRSPAIQYAAHASQEPIYMKIHDAFTRDESGGALVPLDVTAGVIYIIRNPLDVTISFADHNSTTLEKMVKHICSEGYTLAKGIGHLPNQLPQKLRSWSGHVRSWVDESGLDTLVVRYEDILDAPEKTFSGVLRFIGQEIDRQRLGQALEYSSFKNLQEQEQEKGFSEKAPKAEVFFREGRSGGWRDKLNKKQAAKIVEYHSEIMRRFGYLDEKDQPRY